MRTDSRLLKNTKSIKKLKQFLDSVSENPQKYAHDDRVISALSSQGALSKLCIAEEGIFSTSTNTLKRISDSEIEGGFSTLDALRISAKRAISELKETTKIQRRNTREQLAEEKSKLLEKLQQSQQDCWRLTVAFNKAMNQGRRYAYSSGDKTIIALCLKEQKELKAMFSLVTRPEK